MKKQYLDEIRKLLARYVITDAEIADIIADYDRMYEDGLARGMTDDQVVVFLGNPEKVVRELGDSYDRKPGKGYKHGKIIAVMPFVAIIAYFILGMVFHAWHPGWLVFFLIPVSAIILGGEHRNVMGTLTALSPFIAVTAFICLGQFAAAWHPAWLVFLIIPAFGALSDRSWKGKIFAALIVLAAGAYLYVGYALDQWALGALAFIVPITFGAATGFIDIVVEWRRSGTLSKSERRFKLIMTAVVLGVAAIYVILGFALDWWAYAWLVFLAIPMFAIIAKAGRKARIVALSPFIATILFFLVGFFVPGGWTFAWIAFLMIPIIAILKNS